VLFRNGLYRWLIDTEGSLIYLSASFKLLPSLLRWKGWVSSELLGSDKWIGLVTFGRRFSGCISEELNNEAQLLSFKYVSFCSLKRGDCKNNVTSRFHLFPPENISLISGKGNIGLLLICILQAWKWAFKWNFWFSITGELLCFANYNVIWRRRGERWRHGFRHVWINLLLFARWKSSCKRKKIIWSDLFPTDC